MASNTADAFPDDVPLAEYKSVFRPDFLHGKRALITGGGSGIGFRITEALMRHGADVAIASRSMDRLQVASAKLQKATGRKCIPIQMDVRNGDDVDKGVAAAVKELGGIDILINGAAGNFLVPADKITPGAFRTVVNIDTIGTFLVTQAVFKACMKKSGGVIINITATLSWNGELMQVHAGAAKAAVEAMARHLCNEWGKYNVRVNNIAPGPIADTEGFKRLGGFMPPPLIKEFTGRIGLNRLGTRQDISDAVLYLVSDASSYVSGVTLVVDGGAWMTTGGMVAHAMQKMQAKAASSAAAGAGSAAGSKPKPKL